MSRYNFPTSSGFRNSVLKRQNNRCAIKGCSEDDSASVRHGGKGKIQWAWDFHHVIPSQLGDCNRENKAFLKFLVSEDNCVAICSNCHSIAHAGGKTKKGAVAPAHYFKFSHGGKGNSSWANSVERWWSNISFPN